MRSSTVTEAAVWTALGEVIDPELGCNIVDLGLVYSVNVDGGKVSIVMTLTTFGCPMHESIRWGVQNALLALDGVMEADVQVVWDPPWHPSMMTDRGRASVGISVPPQP